MIIRLATFFDVPELLRLADVYVREEVAPAGHHSTEWDAGMMANNLMSSMNAPSDVVLLAIEDGQIVGYLWAASHCLAPWSPIRVASDYLFYVIPERRGSRAAIRLILSYQKWAEGVGCAEVRLSVASGIKQERTGRLYQLLGFSPYAGVYKQAIGE